MGQKQGRPPFTSSCPSRQSSIVQGLSYHGLNLPPPPTHCGPLEARAHWAEEAPGTPRRPHGSQRPAPAWDRTQPPPVSAVPGTRYDRRATLASPAVLSTSQYPDSGTRGEALASAHTPKALRGSLQGGRTIFLAMAALPFPAPLKGRSWRPGLSWVEGRPCAGRVLQEASPGHRVSSAVLSLSALLVPRGGPALLGAFGLNLHLL